MGPRPAARATTEATAHGASSIGLGLILLGIDLSENPTLADVGGFAAVALVVTGGFAFLGGPLKGGPNSRPGESPLGAVESTRQTRWRVAVEVVILSIVVGVILWAGGDEFREDMLDLLGGMAVGAGTGWLLYARRFRAIEARAGGVLLRERRFRWRRPAADYYLKAPDARIETAGVGSVVR